MPLSLLSLSCPTQGRDPGPCKLLECTSTGAYIVQPVALSTSSPWEYPLRLFPVLVVFFQGRLVFFALDRLPAVFPRSCIPRSLKTMGHPDPAHSAVPTNTHPIGSGPSPARSCGFFPSPLGFFMLSPASLLSFPLPLSCLPALLFPSHFLLSGRGDPRAQRASAHACTLTCACTHLFHWFIGKGMM